MEPIESPQHKIQTLFNHISDYVETRMDLIVLDITEKSVDMISGLMGGVIAGLFGLVSLLFVGIGAAKWIGTSLGQESLGYFIMAAVYLILLIILSTYARNYVRMAVVKFVITILKEGEINEKP